MSLEDAFTVAAVTLLATAALTDLAWRRIPNALCLALTGLGLLRLGFDASGWLLPAADLGVAFILLGLGMVAFHYGVFGGGDTKLVAATSLWLGHAQTGSFLFIMALAGGLLALAWLLWRRLTRYPDGQSATLPYGIAIAVAGIAVTLLN